MSRHHSRTISSHNGSSTAASCSHFGVSGHRLDNGHAAMFRPWKNCQVFRDRRLVDCDFAGKYIGQVEAACCVSETTKFPAVCIYRSFGYSYCRHPLRHWDAQWYFDCREYYASLKGFTKNVILCSVILLTLNSIKPWPKFFTLPIQQP